MDGYSHGSFAGKRESAKTRCLFLTVPIRGDSWRLIFAAVRHPLRFRCATAKEIRQNEGERPRDRRAGSALSFLCPEFLPSMGSRRAVNAQNESAVLD
jgi:hypothetical protein